MTDSNPLVSVLIPTYNVEKFVEEAILSILNQTYKNLEIIIVDDASSDNTFNILTNLSEKDDRIKLYRNEKNSKIVESLNFAYKKSSGLFIARMDGDDISLPNRIEHQVQFLVNNVDVDLVGLNVIIIDEAGNSLKNEKYVTDINLIKRVSQFVTPVPHFWVSRRSVYENVGPYRIPSAEDFDFLLRALDLGFNICNVPLFLYKQRIRQGNTASTSGLIQSKSISYIKKLRTERLKNNGIDSYSLDKLSIYTKVSYIERKLFNYSLSFHFKYLSKKGLSNFSAYFNLMIAIFIMPNYHLSHIYNRFRFKRYL
ncbi:glycosyltransferase family 2 protein [Pontibacter sp. CAU 1760]